LLYHVKLELQSSREFKITELVNVNSATHCPPGAFPKHGNLHLHI
jgi:hypothetical protein